MLAYQRYFTPPIPPVFVPHHQLSVLPECIMFAQNYAVESFSADFVKLDVIFEFVQSLL